MSNNKRSSNINSMIEVNLKQKEYYEIKHGEVFEHGGNFISKIWDKIREIQYKVTDDLDSNNKLFDIHKKWLGDLADKKVLDFGCHTGNELSEYLATRSKEYIAVDLSESALKVLEEKLSDKNINARFLPIDILTDEKIEGDFDVIYAKAVFHHFRYFDDFIVRIKSLLKPGGIIICIDPLNTFLPMKIIRSIYSRFQFDSEWEYPFTKESLSIIEKNFTILNTVGLMGKSKYVVPLYLINKKYAIKKGKKWVDQDYYYSKYNDKSLYRCLRVSLLLKKDF